MKTQKKGQKTLDFREKMAFFGLFWPFFAIFWDFWPFFGVFWGFLTPPTPLIPGADPGG